MSTMRFCCQCDNTLYPREDRERRTLLYACRNCDYEHELAYPIMQVTTGNPLEEVADSSCVFRMEIHHSASGRLQGLQDAAADPTLPRTKSVKCYKCNHPEAVFFQAPSEGEEGMALFFICCNPNCSHRWRD